MGAVLKEALKEAIEEDLNGHRKINVKTAGGADAEVEEKRVFYVTNAGSREKITMTFYYTTCSIMLQGTSTIHGELDGSTASQWLANRMETIFKDLLGKVDMKKIVTAMKRDIKAWKDQNSVGQAGGKGNGATKTCAKCGNECKTTKQAAYSQKCLTCDNVQHLKLA